MINLEELQKQLFFEFGHKVDLYHFVSIREIVAVKHGEQISKENALRVYTY